MGGKSKNNLSGLTQDEEYEMKQLFKKLDVNRDGKIDVNDLSTALNEMEIPQMPGHAQKWIREYDTNDSGTIDFREFLHGIGKHKQKLKLSFQSVDQNNDGYIDAEEIQAAFENLGVHIDIVEAENLLVRMDKDKSLRINWDEWLEYLLLHPSSSIHDIVHYWRHATIIDVGEDALVPDDFTESELRSGLWWRHLVAGAAAGAVSRTFTAPLDRLKVLLQVHASPSNNLGLVSGLEQMIKEGGVRSLWRGNGMNVIKIAPESAIKFMAYEQIKRQIKHGTNRELGISERFCAGSMAGAISQTIIYPMEVLKTRLALRRTGQYSTISKCAGEILKKEGMMAFYRGYVPNLLGIIPYAGIDLAIYETLKRLYIKRHSVNEDPGILVLLSAGICSSTCGQLASYPLALIRTKLQAKGMCKEKVCPKDTMSGMFRHIIMTDGPTGLYRGITPNFMKVAPAVSISYVVYEHVRKFLGVQMT